MGTTQETDETSRETKTCILRERRRERDRERERERVTTLLKEIIAKNFPKQRKERPSRLKHPKQDERKQIHTDTNFTDSGKDLL